MGKTIHEILEDDKAFKITSRYMDFSYDGVKQCKRGSNFTPKKKKRKKKC